MPTLKNYTAETPDVPISGGRRAGAEDFGAAVGAGAALLGKGVTTAVDAITQEREREDTLAAHTETAQARRRAIEKLDQLRETGEPVADKFAEFLDGELAGVKANRKTRAGAAVVEHHSANMVADLSHTARMIDVHTAGQRARENAKGVIDANGTVLQKDPTLLGRVIDEQSNLIDQMPRLTDVQRDQLRREMTQEATKNAVRGWTALDPKGTQERLEKGEWDKLLDSEAKHSLILAAEREWKGREAERRIAEAEDRRVRKEKADELMNVSLTKAYSGELKPGDVRKMARDQVITPEQTDRLFSLLERFAKDKTVKSDLSLVVDFVNKNNAGLLTQDEVNNAAINGRLSEQDFFRFSAAVKEGDSTLKRARTETSRNVGQAFFGVFPGFPKTPEQLSAQVQFDALVRDREQEYRKAGKNPLDYYTEGKYEEDARLLAPRRGALGSASAAKPAIPVLGQEVDRDGQKWKYRGGNPATPDAWEPVISFPVTPSGETKQKREARAATEVSARYKAWRESGESERVDFMEWLMTGGKGL